MSKHRYPSLFKITTPLFIILGGWVAIEFINSSAKKLDRDKAVSPPPQQISSVCTTVPENPPAKYLWRVVADKVNIRKQNMVQSDKVGVLYKNTLFSTTEFNLYWLKPAYGYVSADFVERVK